MKNTHGYTLIVKNCRGTLFSSVDTRMEARRTNIRKEKRKKKKQQNAWKFLHVAQKFFTHCRKIFSFFVQNCFSFFSNVAKRSPRTKFIQAYYEAWRIVQRLIRTHTHTYTHARIYAQTHTPTLFKNCAEK